jgi:hypothetical protein
VYGSEKGQDAHNFLEKFKLKEETKGGEDELNKENKQLEENEKELNKEKES